jgi:HlyD family secretion protein
MCILTALFLLGAAGCSQKEAPGPGEEPYIAVEVAQVGRGEINLTARVGGTVKTGGEVAVPARLGGGVKTVHISLGDQVAQGDLLVTLEAPDINLQVRQARDAVNTLRQARDELKDMIEELEERFGGSNGNGFGEPGSGDPPGDGEDPGFELPPWLRDLLEGGISLDPAMSLRQQLATVEAQLKQAERGLEMARLGQANLFVRAPIAGMVTFVNVLQGATVGPGTPLLMLSRQGGYLVEAQVLENLITAIHPGDPVQVELPISGETYAGSVTEAAPAPVPNTRVYPVKIAFEPSGSSRVLPGMFARVAFLKEASGDTLVIPRSAVLPRAAGSTVYIVKDGRAEARLVTLGLQDSERAQVLAGLEEGENLVIRGHHYLDTGTLVKIVGGGEGAGN